MANFSQIAWIAEHIELYKTDPEKAHMWDAKSAGGSGTLPTRRPPRGAASERSTESGQGVAHCLLESSVGLATRGGARTLATDGVP